MESNNPKASKVENSELAGSTKGLDMERGLNVSLLATSAQAKKQKPPAKLTCAQCRWSIGTMIPHELKCQRTMYIADKICDSFEYEPGTVE